VRAAGLDRLAFRLERLRVELRVTYAFHARELRFELDAGEGYRPLFPEIFSLHADRHDPAELYIQLEDLWSRPRLIAPGANRRDAELVVRRLASGLPLHLERVLERVTGAEGTRRETLERVHADVAVLSCVMLRFLSDKRLDEVEPQRMAVFHLRRLVWESLAVLVQAHVREATLERYRRGELPRPALGEDPTESSLLAALARRSPDRIEQELLPLAERAFHGWLEDVCLDEANGAFELEDSPFDDRETEVLRACAALGVERIVRTRDLSPFLRRQRNKDCARLLEKVKRFFLRQYDVVHSSQVILHMARMQAGRDEDDRVLTRHSGRNYAIALGTLLLPFLVAAFAYDSAPVLLDTVVAGELVFLGGVIGWFLLWRFVWKRDLSLFHAGVPRIGAGIIVGYLPVFLIDEVWSLSLKADLAVAAVALLLGLTTLLYLYVEVQRRLGESPAAFARARALFLLGLLQAFVFGLLATSLIGRFMATRAFMDESGLPFDALVAEIPRFAGELPRVMGFEPLLVFPTTVILMTVLSIFIGTFLQLLWEDLPITDPL